jgi:PPK2 family polyphosphate:nucleotide phosphotransferase
MGKGKKDKKKKKHKDSSGKGHEKAAKKAAKVSEAREEISEDGARLGGFSDALRVGRGFSLVDVDTSSTPAFDGDEDDGEAALEAGHAELSDLMERLFAESTAGSKRALLLVVQGMDTSGKGGLMRHVISVSPESVRATAFKQPTAEELAHDFLWRIERALPAAGQLGVFDRSHYEDVLVVRVHDIVEPEVWKKRYAQINAFERRVDRSGTTVIKVMTHISKEEQRERLLERLSRPDKYYKYHPGDVDERGHWLEYMEAYQAVIDRTSTVVAPWHVVPADHKWYARLAVQQLLLEALRSMNLSWPPADFDIEVEKKRLAES